MRSDDPALRTASERRAETVKILAKGAVRLLATRFKTNREQDFGQEWLAVCPQGTAACDSNAQNPESEESAA